MKVIDRIKNATSPIFSYEIVPPPRGRSIQDIIKIVEALKPLSPAWIDVTAHSSSAYYNELSDGTIQKKVYKKRPGTIGICGVIQNRFGIDTVAHLLCLGFSKEETEDALLELNFLGVQNVLALRGDSPNYSKPLPQNRSANYYASDLVEQINKVNKGQFLEDIEGANDFDFCVGVAGYPEKHFEAPNLKLDLQNLKKKVDAGAEYITTQMFFDNRHYFDFVKAAREIGITVPIVPGLKVLKTVSQLVSIPKNFYIDLPNELVDQVTNNPKEVKQIGFDWAKKQAKELLAEGAPAIHFYIMNDTETIVKLVSEIQSELC